MLYFLVSTVYSINKNNTYCKYFSEYRIILHQYIIIIEAA